MFYYLHWHRKLLVPPSPPPHTGRCFDCPTKAYFFLLTWWKQLIQTHCCSGYVYDKHFVYHVIPLSDTQLTMAVGLELSLLTVQGKSACFSSDNHMINMYHLQCIVSKGKFIRIIDYLIQSCFNLVSKYIVKCVHNSSSVLCRLIICTCSICFDLRSEWEMMLYAWAEMLVSYLHLDLFIAKTHLISYIDLVFTRYI